MEDQKTQIIVGDARIIAAGHSPNKASCIAIGAAIQTFGRVCAMLGMLSRPIDMDPKVPKYDVCLHESEQAQKAIAGVLDSILEISRICPNSIELSDNRKHRPSLDAEMFAQAA